MASFKLIAEDGTSYSFNWNDSIDVIASRGRGNASVEFLRDQEHPFILCNTVPNYGLSDVPLTNIKIVQVETTITEDRTTTIKQYSLS